MSKTNNAQPIYIDECTLSSTNHLFVLNVEVDEMWEQLSDLPEGSVFFERAYLIYEELQLFFAEIRNLPVDTPAFLVLMDIIQESHSLLKDILRETESVKSTIYSEDRDGMITDAFAVETDLDTTHTDILEDSRRRVRKQVTISNNIDPSDGDVTISIQIKPKKPTKSSLILNKIRQQGSDIASKINSKNSTTPDQTRIYDHKKEASTRWKLNDPLLESCLEIPLYAQFVKKHYASSKVFREVVYNQVKRIESRSVDAVDRWLGDQCSSLFEHLKYLTAQEVFALIETKDIRYVLEEKNVKYESLIDWIEFTTIMLEETGLKTDTKFGLLFMVWFIESEMTRVGYSE
jgi:hypothetical protein